MSNDYGKTDVQLMNENLTRQSGINLANQLKETQSSENDYIRFQIAQYSDKNINETLDSRDLYMLYFLSNIVKINSLKNVVDSYDLSRDEKITMFDGTLSDISNKGNLIYDYLKEYNNKGYSFLAVFPRIINKALKDRF